MNKYTYVKVLQGLYGGLYGWEDISEVPNSDREAITELREDLLSYRESMPEYPYRIVMRRVPNSQEDTTQ